MPSSNEARGTGQGAPLASRVRPLGEVFRSRDAKKLVGAKALAFATFSRADIAIPESWVIDAHEFEAFVAAHLPRKHELRSLVKLAGTPEGEEFCARAYEELIGAPLPDELTLAVRTWWEALSPRPSLGIAIRPSIVAAGDRASDAGRFLHAEVAPDALAPVLDAIRRVWASAVTSLSVGRYSECGVKEVGVAVLLQRAVPTGSERWLTRVDPRRHGESGHAWQLGAVVRRVDGAEELALAPLALGLGATLPSALAPVFSAISPQGFERLARIVDTAEKALGPEAVVAFVHDEDKEPSFTVLRVDESPRWRSNEGDPDATWLEVLVGREERAPRRALSECILSRSVERATLAGLHALGASTDEPRRFVWTSGGRTYLGLHALAAALHDVPGIDVRDVFSATGTGSMDLFERLVRKSGGGKRRLREAVQGATLIARQARLLRDAHELERTLQREARALAEMDLTLLPTDGIATTLGRIDELLGRTVELWARLGASQLCHHVAIAQLIHRSESLASEVLATTMTSGASGSFGASLTLAFARAVDVVRGDAAACTVLGGATSLADLPDGPARGALGQFLSSFGDVVRDPFDLSKPRWSEDPREVFSMLRAWIAAGDSGRTRVEIATERARARADAELARYEPELGWIERSALRAIIERAREVSRAGAAVERLVYRTLSLFRTVMRDADRRVKRIDSRARTGGVFDCSLERLIAAFRTGRPEIDRVVVMREAEALQHGGEAPPIAFVGSPPRLPLPVSETRLAETGRRGLPGLRGLGASAGVVDAPVSFEPSCAGGVHVARVLDVADVPWYFLHRGVVGETGGVLSCVAGALRELGIPAVVGAEYAHSQLRPRESIRIDGQRGVIVRDAAGAAP